MTNGFHPHKKSQVEVSEKSKAKNLAKPARADQPAPADPGPVSSSLGKPSVSGNG